MKRLLFLFLCAVLFSTAALALDAPSAQEPPPDTSGYLVLLPHSSMRLFSAQQSGEITSVPYARDLYLADSLEAAERLADGVDGAVIEPDYPLYLHDAPRYPMDGPDDRTDTPNAVHFSTIRADSAMSSGCFGQDLDLYCDMGGDGDVSDPIVVAVIDSGLYARHEDLDPARIVPGQDFTNSLAGVTDTDGHGTFVAGEIIASLNDLGIDGLASQAYIMPLKVFDRSRTSTACVVSAIRCALEQRTEYERTNGAEGHNVCVINMSLGGDIPSRILQSAVEDAIDAGIIVVCSAGNDGNSLSSYPAQYAIGVGSTDPDGGLDDYAGTYTQVLSPINGSGYKNKVWVTAPGTDYTSLWCDGDCYTGSGTSFSAPLVSALAALSVSLANDLTTVVEENAVVDDGSGNRIAVTNNHLAFKLLLRQTADLTNYGSRFSARYRSMSLSDGQDLRYGYGMIDVEAMLGQIRTALPHDVRFFCRAQSGGALASPRVVVTDGAGREYPASVSDGAVSFMLKNGEYAYRVTEDTCVPVSGTFTVSGTRQTDENGCLPVSITLPELSTVCRCSVAADVEDGAKLTAVLYDAQGTPLARDEDGLYYLPEGSYTCALSCPGYQARSCGFTVTPALLGGELPLHITLLHLYPVIFSVMPDGLVPTLTVYNEAQEVQQPTGPLRYELTDGSYRFLLSCPGYQNYMGSFRVSQGARTVAPTLIEQSYVALSRQEVTLKIKGTAQLKATLTGNTDGSRLTWESSNERVARVSSKGKITGVSAGSCTIIATDTNGGVASCEVEVVRPITALSLSLTKLSLIAGQSREVLPIAADVTGLAEHDYALDYDERYVRAELTAEDTIRVTALDSVVKSTSVKLTDRISGKSAKLTVSVGREADGVTTTMKSRELTLLAGKRQTLKATAVLLDSRDKPLNKAVSWLVDDPSVAAVDDSGRVRALSTGTCTVTAEPVQGTGALHFTITVLPVLKSVSFRQDGAKVTKLRAAAGESIDAAALLELCWSKGEPVTGEEYTVTFSTTAKSAVAALDSETGVLTCLGKGSAKLSVKVACGTQKKTATLTVTVTP